MKLDISDLLNKDIASRRLDIVLEENEFYDGVEHDGILQPIKFLGSLDKTGDMFVLRGRVNTVLELTCSRCLKKFPRNVDLDIEEQFTNQEDINRVDDIILIKDGYIDIAEIIENNIIVTLPIKRLCRKDCRGLCPKCGTDLNKSTCNCKNNNIDLRWEKLRDMFPTD